MESARKRRSIILFCLRFLGLVTVLVVVWWLLLPVYGWLLVQSSGALLTHLFSVPIEYGGIAAEGILNTRSLLVFGIDGRESQLAIALLVTNVPPYLALVFATAGLGWKRRLAITAWGLGILALGHVVFIVYALRLQLAARLAAESQQLSELPTAIAQFYLTLPFLLWIVFAYWERIVAYLGEEEEEAEALSHAAEQDSQP